MKRSDLERIMQKHVILNCDIEHTIGFVSDLLQFAANEIEEDTHMATKAVDRYYVSIREVNDLLKYIKECEED